MPPRLIVVVHGEEGIEGLDKDGVGVEGPVEVIEDGGEGVGNGDVVVNEEAVLVAAAFGDMGLSFLPPAVSCPTPADGMALIIAAAAILIGG